MVRLRLEKAKFYFDQGQREKVTTEPQVAIDRFSRGWSCWGLDLPARSLGVPVDLRVTGG